MNSPLASSLGGAARQRVAGFAAQLRTVADTSLRVPNLEWNVAELAQHVACLPAFWMNQHAAGRDFVRPDDFALYSDQARAHITESDAATLADLIESEFTTALDTLEATPETRWLYGVEITSAHLIGMALNETILHGRDLAGVTGADAPMYERHEANAAVDATMKTLPCFIDATKAAAQPDGVYHLSFRGGNEYTWTKHGATLTVEPGRPHRADARLSADPATFLLASLGRISQVRAGLSGKMVSYGRKPWRFLGLGTIAVDGV